MRSSAMLLQPMGPCAWGPSSGSAREDGLALSIPCLRCLWWWWNAVWLAGASKKWRHGDPHMGFFLSVFIFHLAKSLGGLGQPKEKF